MSFKWPKVKGPNAFLFASFSDWHLGVRRNDPYLMRQALRKALFLSGLMMHIKLLIIAGDFFDRLLHLAEASVTEADLFIAELFRECEKHGVILRVLEGTQSHDARQNVRFNSLFSIINPKIDFKYFDQVEIERIEALQVNVLYIPDEAHLTTDKTKEVVQALLKSRGIDQVDIGVMHGFFLYQIPHGAKEGSYHDIEFYQSIVKFWITIGHVHTRSRFGNILAQGSFDRITHGEEGAKGYVIASVRNEGGDEAWFIDNPDAYTYKTVNVSGLEVKEALDTIHAACTGLRRDSKIRVEAEKAHPIFANFKELTDSWPAIVFTKHARDAEEKTIVEKILDDKIKDWTSVKLDGENIRSLIAESLNEEILGAPAKSRILRKLEGCL